MKNPQTIFKRCEKKYMLTAYQANELLRRLQRHIKQDEYGRYTNCSIYFDTHDYRALGNGTQRDYKEKLRLRSYGVPKQDDIVFLELKKKLDGVGYKRRVPMTLQAAEEYLRYGTPPPEGGQVFEEVDWFHRHFAPQPMLALFYDRTAFGGVEDPSLRITFDTNVRWREKGMWLAGGDWGEDILAPGHIVMESKVSGAYPLWLSHALSAVGAYPTSFSKYRAACECKKRREAACTLAVAEEGAKNNKKGAHRVAG